MKTKFLKFSESRKKYVFLVLPLIIIASVIPFDSYFNVFTPRVNYYANAKVSSDIEYFLFLNAECLGYNEKPQTEISYRQKIYEIYQIVSGPYDRLNTVFIPIKSGKNVKLQYDSSIFSYDWNELLVITPYSLKDNLTIKIVPSESDANGLLVNYEKMKGRTFNITLSYWKETQLSDVTVMPLNLRGIEFNETYDVWIQEFKITNNGTKEIFICEVRYDRLNFEEVKKDTVNVAWNGKTIDPITIRNVLIKLPILKIARNETVTLTISFLSTNKFPR